MKTKPVILIMTLIAMCVIFLKLQNSYGMDYNNIRRQLQIPMIGSDWKLQREFWLSEFTYNNNSIKDHRYHLKKTVKVNLFNNIQEEDDYYIIEDKQIAIDVVYFYNKNQPWSIKYYDLKKSVEQNLLRTQLTDSLKKYDVQ